MTDEGKIRAARTAIELLPREGVIGLGTGTTARYFLEHLALRIRGGARYVGVATSVATETQARELGIPLLSADEHWVIDVTVDGADEVSPSLDLIKGGGGAHTREKIVNYASQRNIIAVDSSKLVPLLGTTFAVPVEVLSFGLACTQKRLAAWGRAEVRIRAGSRSVTDSGNAIIDVHTGPIADPAALDAALRLIPGVVETGLFVGRAETVVVGYPDRSEVLTAAR